MNAIYRATRPKIISMSYKWIIQTTVYFMYLSHKSGRVASAMWLVSREKGPYQLRIKPGSYCSTS